MVEIGREPVEAQFDSQIIRRSSRKAENHCGNMLTLSEHNHVWVSPYARQKARKDPVVTLDSCWYQVCSGRHNTGQKNSVAKTCCEGRCSLPQLLEFDYPHNSVKSYRAHRRWKPAQWPLTCAQKQESSTIALVTFVSNGRSFILMVFIFKKSCSTEDWNTSIKD